MVNNEPIRHHFIPQFIIRSFGIGSMHIQYYDKLQRRESYREIREVFMGQYLYRDDRHHPDNLMQIETDLGEFEREMAPVIKRFVNDADIVITKEEDEKLKLFFSIMGFRAKSVSKSYSTNIKQITKAYLGKYLQDEEYIDLWRRNLGLLAKCRSCEEVLSNSAIDKPIRDFVRRDMKGYHGTYFAVVQSDDSEEFVLGDVYPTEVRYGEFPMYEVFPISPSRAILQCWDGIIKDVPPSERGLSKMACFQHPKEDAAGSLRIHIRNIDVNDLNEINRMVFNAAEEGIVFKNKTAAIGKIIGEII